MTETKITAREAREQLFARVRQAPEYELPVLEKFLTRIKKGVPTDEAGQLYERELALARAKAGHDGV